MAKCGECDQDVLHVRDDFTGGTFPVNEEPTIVRGYRLGPPLEGERNRRAKLEDVELFIPHAQTCEQLTAGEGDG